jgi:hypothetical protein
VPALVRVLEDVRARPFVADALGTLGDRRAVGPLLDAMATEHYVTVRPHEARALVALGTRIWTSPDGGVTTLEDVRVPIARPGSGARVLVRVSDDRASVDVELDGAPLSPLQPEATGIPAEGGAEIRAFDVDADGSGGPARARPRPGASVTLQVHASEGSVVGVWVVAPGPT